MRSRAPLPRVVALAAVLATPMVSACATSTYTEVDLTHAGGRARRQTRAEEIRLVEGDVDRAYDVLGDISVVVEEGRNDEPTTPEVEDILRVQAGKLGAHAVILVWLGRERSSVLGKTQLRGRGRAIRYR